MTLAGFMGAGKTSVARAVSQLTGRPWTDLDTVVATAAGMSISNLVAQRGEPSFRALEAAEVDGCLVPGQILALGGGTTIDDRVWASLRDRSVTVWLDVPVAELWSRVASQRARGGSDIRPLATDEAAFRALFDRRLTRYSECEHRVDATRSIAAVAREVAALWHA